MLWDGRLGTQSRTSVRVRAEPKPLPRENSAIPADGSKSWLYTDTGHLPGSFDHWFDFSVFITVIKPASYSSGFQIWCKYTHQHFRHLSEMVPSHSVV